jgi:hypothetical protein
MPLVRFLNEPLIERGMTADLIAGPASPRRRSSRTAPGS